MELNEQRLHETFLVDIAKGSFSVKQPKGQNLDFGDILVQKEDGDLYIAISEGTFKAKDVIWYLKFGKFPDQDLQFVDGNKLNIAIDNLFEPPKVVTPEVEVVAVVEDESVSEIETIG